MAESSELIGRIRDLDPKGDEFAEVMQVMAEKVADLRGGEGRVTPGIFYPMLKLVGVHPAIEALVTGPMGELLLKRRAPAENITAAEQKSWGGKLHIPGSIFNAARSLSSNFYSLLDLEVVGLEDPDQHAGEVIRAIANSSNFGTYVSYLPERQIAGFTLLMKVPFSDISILQPGFEAVGYHNLNEVIEQHQPVVRRVRYRLSEKDPLEAIIFDTRS
jgi:hypothetical protein